MRKEGLNYLKDKIAESLGEGLSLTGSERSDAFQIGGALVVSLRTVSDFGWGGHDSGVLSSGV